MSFDWRTKGERTVEVAVRDARADPSASCKEYTHLADRMVTREHPFSYKLSEEPRVREP